MSQLGDGLAERKLFSSFLRGGALRCMLPLACYLPLACILLVVWL